MFVIRNTDFGKSKNILLINCTKFVAIIAVLINHAHIVLGLSKITTMISLINNSTFIIISGILCYKSNERRKTDDYWNIFIRTIKKITIAYAIGTLIYQIVSDYCNLEKPRNTRILAGYVLQ